MAVTDFDPETRLQILNQELAKAREIIADLDARKLATQHQVLRIEGAIALIGEILAAKPVAAPAPLVSIPFTGNERAACQNDRCDLRDGHVGPHGTRSLIDGGDR